ncbi:CPBP family intramembrane metalloprotease [Candidatus Saccharibacteria bacterium]|nr:CPBP family intramembrane metalloprotease [Candidatus Saccharibacteria bacterium]
MNKARPELPKNTASARPAGAKKPRPKLPLRQALRTTCWTVLMLSWTILATKISNFVVVYLFVIILGAETASQPAWEGLIFSLVYLLTILLTIVIPPRLIAWLRLTPESRRTWRRNSSSTSPISENPAQSTLSPSISEKSAKTTKKPRLGASRATLGFSGWPTWADIGLAPVGYAVYFLLAMGVIAIFMNFPWFNAEEKQDLVYETTVVGLDRIIAFASYVVIAPIAEETIFRGWLYGRLRERFSEKLSNKLGMFLSVFLVSLTFALVHQNLVVGICVFILSIILCALREITGTIYAGILVHMIVNGVAFYQNYIAQM